MWVEMLDVKLYKSLVKMLRLSSLEKCQFVKGNKIIYIFTALEKYN